MAAPNDQFKNAMAGQNIATITAVQQSNTFNNPSRGQDRTTNGVQAQGR
jgi:hypothetical protein